MLRLVRSAGLLFVVAVVLGQEEFLSSPPVAEPGTDGVLRNTDGSPVDSGQSSGANAEGAESEQADAGQSSGANAEGAEASEDGEKGGEDHSESDSGEGDDAHEEPLHNYYDQEPISKEQLQKLHTLWDKDGDGKASIQEILHYASSVHLDLAKKNVDSSLKLFDTGGDGHLNLEEVMGAAVGHDDVRTDLDKQRFHVADQNGDGILDKHELPHFFHPETHNESLKLMAMDTLRRRDVNGDGKLTEAEFMQLEDGETLDDTDEFQAEFKRLDKNGDGHLDAHELMPWESGMSHIEHAMSTLFKEADANNDNHVTLDELEAASHKIAGSDAHHYLAEWMVHATEHNDL